jgi:hypothetical protein
MKKSVSGTKKSPKKKRPKGDLLATLSRKRDRALDRVVAIWEKSGDPNEDGEELNNALDVLTIAHIAATFDFAGGPHKW